MLPLRGWDEITKNYFKPITNNYAINIYIMVGLNFGIVFFILWVLDGF